MKYLKPVLTPSDLEVLIHCHAIPTPHPRWEAPAVREALNMFLKAGIIEVNHHLTDRHYAETSHVPGIARPMTACVFSTTEKGKQLLESICNLELHGQCRDSKCLVKGCENHRADGHFIGALCAPCYGMLETGQIGPGATFLHDLYDHYRELVDTIGERNERAASLVPRGITLIDAYRTSDGVVHTSVEEAEQHTLNHDFREALIAEGVGRGGHWDDTMIAAAVLNLKGFKVVRR